MSLSINYSSGIGLHGVDPISVSKDLIEWVSSYSDITITGKTNFKNDINLLYDELNYLNISIDQYSNTTLDITSSGQNGTLIINNRVNANNGLVIDGTISYGSTNKTASLYIKGTGANNPANRLVILSGETIVDTGGDVIYRGLTLTIINGQTLQHVSSTNYDTYQYTSDADDLADAINDMTHTQIGILTSWDSFTRYITTDLRTAAMRVGLTKLAKAASSGTNYVSREPYAAIFYGTSSDSDNDPQYIRDVIEIYRNNDDRHYTEGNNAGEPQDDGTDEAPPAIISTTLSSDGNYAGIAGASSVNALWAASPVIENPALICDSSGNVGIGTTNPEEKLHVVGDIKGTNFIGNVDGTLDNYDSSRFFRREGRTNASVGPGWISVATCANSRYAGEILVTDREGGDHGYIRIHWMRSYLDSNFTVINCGGHSNRITGARVLYQSSSNTYGEKILQVYVTVTSNYYVSVFRMGDDPNYGTFTALTPVVENTKTGFELHGNELTNLDAYGFAHEEGILAGGNMKVNGDLIVNGTSPYSILQVKHISTQNQTKIRAQNLSDSAANISGLSINFTPKKSTSKILLTAMITSSGTYVTTFGFKKDSSVLASPSGTNENSDGSITTTWHGDSTTDRMRNYYIEWLDNATNTNARTYIVVGCSSWLSGLRDLYINHRGVTPSTMSSFSSMTIYEIDY